MSSPEIIYFNTIVHFYLVLFTHIYGYREIQREKDTDRGLAFYLLHTERYLVFLQLEVIFIAHTHNVFPYQQTVLNYLLFNG